ncbi:sugar phosphate isomerase/epimerase family protein [Flavilitoribacter nigricans]|uniref:Xylose isomerase n=1 Tax=Flavilitoribacter nigricans (strain ATCC 23147 / DSM 23189 / NBRC 102662 / NCIMB 1420 / SS-2) TaxID=1122177 RepID=A0A2D0NA59_FLAN2|nr:sugar phosphate isomerase/epimerase family protein [Flavilitoribacter nigricans]PHN04663.1 xylose isomerase [Flavilitoribacter nigricans DSM 23189 = NBRC 102662]
MDKHQANGRRKFLATAGLITAAGLAPGFGQKLNLGYKPPKFKMCLNPGIIGVQAGQEELLYMAVEYSFESIISMPNDLAAMSDKKLKEFRQKMKRHKISWGSTNLPVEFRKEEARFREDLAKLPAAAQALKRAGATRMNTWVLNGDNELTYLRNFQQHTDRLGACAEILEAHGISLGLEYVSPKTLMTRFKYPFVRSMAEARELITAIGRPNVGLVLDSFHWYCAGDTKEDILALDKKDIITCDINDARYGLTPDTQQDGSRELPMTTGVIDLKPFLEALVEIGYDGPVRAEPFNKELNEMDNQAALKATYAAMRKAFDLVQ